MFNGALVDVCRQVYDYSASVRKCQKLLINVVPGAGVELPLNSITYMTLA
jgi:hypothetical protein